MYLLLQQVSDNNISLIYDRRDELPGPFLSRNNVFQITFRSSRNDYGRGFLSKFQAGIIQWRNKEARGGTRPGAQALGAHQHIFISHLKTRFKQKLKPK